MAAPCVAVESRLWRTPHGAPIFRTGRDLLWSAVAVGLSTLFHPVPIHFDFFAADGLFPRVCTTLLLAGEIVCAANAYRVGVALRDWSHRRQPLVISVDET